MYQRGRGVERDLAKAMEWYRKSADQGNAVAFYRIGRMYRKGLGVSADNEKAHEWYLRSAQRGYYLGQYNLGVLLAWGRGVPEDLVEAHKWVSLAYKKRSREFYAHWLGEIESRMTYDEIAEAKKRAKAWKRVSVGETQPANTRSRAAAVVLVSGHRHDGCCQYNARTCGLSQKPP